MILDLHEKGLLDGVDPVLRLRLIQATLAKEAALSSITQTGFLSYLPPWPMLIILGLGVFFTRLISNFGDIAPSLISQGWKKIRVWRSTKDIKDQ